MTKSKSLTTKHLMVVFAVTHMTIKAFREGSASRSALPTISHDNPENRAVLFKPSVVKSWAKTNGVPIINAEALDPAYHDAPVKPGPKARTVALKALVSRDALRTAAKERRVSAATRKAVEPYAAVRQSLRAG